MLVIGGVWVVVYNSDLLLALILALFGRMPGAPPGAEDGGELPDEEPLPDGYDARDVLPGGLHPRRDVVHHHRDRPGLLGRGGDLRRLRRPRFCQLPQPHRGYPRRVGRPGAGAGGGIRDTRLRRRGFHGASGGRSGSPRWRAGPPAQQADPGEFAPRRGRRRIHSSPPATAFTLRAGSYESDRAGVARPCSDEPDTAVVVSSVVPTRADYSAGAPDPPFMFRASTCRTTPSPTCASPCRSRRRVPPATCG